MADRAWVRLPSGRRLDLLAPTPFDWTDADLATGYRRRGDSWRDRYGPPSLRNDGRRRHHSQLALERSDRP